MKICVIVPTHWQAVMGGSQYQAKLLIEHLAASGEHEIYYLARQVPEALGCEKTHRVIRIAPARGIGRWGKLTDVFDLVRHLERIGPDAVYQRVGCAYTGAAAYYCKKHDKRCVWHVAHDQEVTPFAWRLTRHALFDYVDKRILEYGIRNASDIVTQTRQQAELLRRHYGRGPSAIVPNYHPLPARRPKKSRPITVAWIANLKPWKRPEVFLRLARDLSGMKDVQFVMIGAPRGNPAWCRRIRHEAERLPNLRFLGGQPQDRVNEVLSEAHVFVNTSTQEGFANTFIQAWQRCVPVLSLSVNPDGLLDEGRIGICAGSYANLARELVRLIRDEPLRERMGEAARLHAAATYADRAHLDTLARLITGAEGIAPETREKYPQTSEAPRHSALERTMPR
ncbi:MAG: glycosyltransferase family 4 protein [Gammaproteobacteria bacterium]|nr:hypothetical protein [Gammaproteobacteria bacterium]